MAQTYKFGRGTWATKEGSTLAYNDENENYKPLPFSFERDSIATRVNKEGLIEVVGKDIPRIDYTDSAEGVLLLENSATNLVTHSEDFSDSSWLKNLGTVSITSEIAPNGTTNSVYNYVGNNSNLYTISQASGVEYTISFYLKSNGQGADDFKLRLGNSFSDTMTATTEWKRYSFTATAASNVFSLSSNGVNDVNLLIWGAMLEQNSFSTSYIPTSGSSVPRVAETANGSGNSEVFNDSEGVLFADIAALANDLTYRVLGLSDGTTSNRIILYYNPSSNNIELFISSGGAAQTTLSLTLTDIKLFQKVAVKYKVNDIGLWINGFEVGTDTSATMPIGLNKLAFDNSTGAQNFYGKTKEIGCYDTALTDAELEYLTSYRSLNELVTELNLNTL
jgi:hypothetical protein